MNVPPTTHSTNIAKSIQLREQLRALDGRYLNDPKDALRMASALLETAKQTGDKNVVAGCQMEIAKCHRQLSDLSKSGKAFREALALYTSLGDRMNIPKALQGLGTIHSASGKLQEALQCFTGALPLAESNQDWYVVQRILNSWGIVCIRLGDYQGAMKCFQKCLSSLLQLPDRYLESSVLANIGGIFERTEAYDIAKEYFERSLVIARELDDKRQIVCSLVFLANTALRQSKLQMAREYAVEASTISARYHFHDMLSQSWLSLAEIALAGDNAQEALSLLEQARMLVAETPNNIHFQKVEHGLGVTYLQLGDLEQASAYLSHAIELANAVGSPQLLYETYLHLADLASRSHDYKLANEYLMSAFKQHEVLHNEKNMNAVSMLEFQLMRESAQHARTTPPNLHLTK